MLPTCNIKPLMQMKLLKNICKKRIEISQIFAKINPYLLKLKFQNINDC